MKIRLLGAELFHPDGLTELTVAFRNFENAPKTTIVPVSQRIDTVAIIKTSQLILLKEIIAVC